MPQARLPDVNTAFITYRREAIASLKSYDYRACWGALNCLNALLPEKYRVVLDSTKFTDESKTRFIYCCGQCGERTEKSQIGTFDYPLDSLEALSTDRKAVKVWRCPKCRELNNLEHTDIIKDVLTQPSFLHTVPQPPERKNGLLGRATFRREFSAWAWNFLYELEERMAQFRDDNWSKDEEYAGNDGFDGIDEEAEAENENTPKGVVA